MDHQENHIWQKRITDYEASGVSVAEFAKAHNLSVHQFYYWKNKLIKTESTPEPTPKARDTKNLIKVIPIIPSSQNLPDPQWLASFIKALYEIH